MNPESTAAQHHSAPQPRVLIESINGFDTPRLFCERFDTSDWNYDPDHAAVILGDTDENGDSWAAILDTATMTDEIGQRWSLFSDGGSLFAVPDTWDLFYWCDVSSRPQQLLASDERLQMLYARAVQECDADIAALALIALGRDPRGLPVSDDTLLAYTREQASIRCADLMRSTA